MTNLQRVLRSFSASRARQPDIQKAVDEVCDTTGLGKEEVLNILEVAGVYVLPGSKMENSIRKFISSADKADLTPDELAREVGFRFVISTKEAKRLVGAEAGR